MCGDTIVITIRAGTSGKGVSRRFRSKKTSTCGPSCVIRGTECLAGKPRRPRGSLAVVFGGGIRRWEACGHVASRPDSAQQGLARLGQPAAKRIRIGGVAEVYRAWYALWKRVMATCHGRAIGAGSESSSAWSTPTPREKVECPLCPPQRQRQMASYHEDMCWYKYHWWNCGGSSYPTWPDREIA